MKRNLIPAALALLAALPLAAQENPFGPDNGLGGFGESVDVRVVNVEAVVIDGDGQRVRGLKPEDFRLLVDGREVPVEFFTEIVEGAVASSPARDGEATAPAPIATGQETVGRSILVFVDDSFSIAPQRNRVLQEVERSLSQLAPGDRVAVVSFNGKNLDLLSEWTADRDQLAMAFATARGRRAHGHYILANRKLLNLRASEGAAIQGFTPLPVPTTVNNWGAVRESNAELNWNSVNAGLESGWAAPDIHTPLARVVTAASAAMRGLPAPGGRKAMLILSGGWPLFDEESFGSLLNTVPAYLHSGMGEDLYRPVVDTANLLGYTLYPVDVPGLDPSSTGVDIEDIDLESHHLISSEWERATHTTLGFMARETGGEAAFNSNRLKALDRMAEDTGTYYWLGFTPAWRADDQRHRIELKAVRPGLRIRTRSGFSDLSRSTEMAMTTEGLLMFGGLEGQAPEAHRIKVEMGEPRRAGMSAVQIPVVLHIPAEALTAVPVADGGYAVDATLSLGALDRWGARSDLPIVPLRLTMDRQPRPGDILRYRTVLKMRRGQQRVVFAVRDSLSGEMLWANLDYKP